MAQGKYAKKNSGKGGLILLLIVTLLVVTGCVVGILMLINGENPETPPQQGVETAGMTDPSQPEQTTEATTVPAATVPATQPAEETTAPVEETTTPIEETTAPTELPPLGGEDTPGQKIAQTALAQVGKPYQYGGSGPDGFDTTGFVWYCLKENGISVTRRMKQMVQEGREVAREALQPGDVVFFWSSNEGVVEYLGIYVGDGKFVAARNESNPVSEMDLNGKYFSARYLIARRFAD